MFSILRSLSVSVWAILDTGTPVQLDTTIAISSTVTSEFSCPCFSFHDFFVSSTCSRRRCSVSRKEAAFSNSWLCTAASFSLRTSSSFCSSSFKLGGVVNERSLTFEPASSIKSIALSGRKRSEIYLSESLTAASMASSVIETRWWASYLSRRPCKI
ncbi:Uncharacterised protein [Bacillus subtilis]|nr:Uncharacterised protein [Bacillus subtilis]